MRKLTLTLVAAAGLSALTIGTLQAQGGPAQLPGQADVSRVEAGTYKVDSAHSMVGWKLNHFGFNDYFGIFGDVSGTITADPANPTASKVDVTIPIASVTVPSAALKLDPLWTQDEIQNGGPDGVALVDTVKGGVVDAISYEGSITAANVSGLPAPINLVEGTALDSATADSTTATATLCRLPNGGDSNDAMTDWKICATRTIGTANAP